MRKQDKTPRFRDPGSAAFLCKNRRGSLSALVPLAVQTAVVKVEEDAKADHDGVQYVEKPDIAGGGKTVMGLDGLA